MYILYNSMKVNYSGEYYNDHLYCVIACCDSIATEIEDGDEIICDPTVPIQNGDIVHYTINGESAVKLYNKDESNNLIEFILNFILFILLTVHILQK